jgi:hypothetical protein
MWQINEILSFDGHLYRILAINPGEIVWIQISDDKGVPEFVLEIKLLQYLDEGRLIRNTDPYANIHADEPKLVFNCINSFTTF